MGFRVIVEPQEKAWWLSRCRVESEGSEDAAGLDTVKK